MTVVFKELLTAEDVIEDSDAMVASKKAATLLILKPAFLRLLAAAKSLLERSRIPFEPVRVKLPEVRDGLTRHFTIHGAGEDGPTDVYVTVNDYSDGRPGEVFLRVGQIGGLARGALDAVGIAISIGLQHGVPLKMFTSKLRGMQFPPSGLTGDKKYNKTGSVLDLVARYLEDRYGIAEKEDPK